MLKKPPSCAGYGKGPELLWSLSLLLALEHVSQWSPFACEACDCRLPRARLHFVGPIYSRLSVAPAQRLLRLCDEIDVMLARWLAYLNAANALRRMMNFWGRACRCSWPCRRRGSCAV